MDTAATMPAIADDELLFRPNTSLNGSINADALPFFLERLGEVRQQGTHLVLELNTQGGDADIGRRIALEIRLVAIQANRPTASARATSIRLG
ncbi:hypothetical protein NKJ59_24105 [Mesorhizobium australicum]|uniref:hypothetical protein n=1 Tax=Mesorhizobium australicum TaxID=536018 RepID=UPI003338CA12